MKDLNVDLFTLCQGVHDWGGHLTIVNTIDEFLIKELPARISFGLALKIYIRANVEGDHTLKISIKNHNDGKEIFPPIPSILKIEKKERISHVNIAVNLQNVLFEKEGTYDIHLEIDEKRFDDFAFEVIKE